ncbi:interleukin-22 [Dromiciops gliroides]|uniref:interleukin-22 n=1 Tax=Dromiciops gliroides TaxID=33562 RepID=UPI001CC3484C|nr:interleukin-22 [Dromiciops gliroides]
MGSRWSCQKAGDTCHRGTKSCGVQTKQSCRWGVDSWKVQIPAFYHGKHWEGVSASQAERGGSLRELGQHCLSQGESIRTVKRLGGSSYPRNPNLAELQMESGQLAIEQREPGVVGSLSGTGCMIASQLYCREDSYVEIYHLIIMETQQNLVSFFPMKTWALCFLLMIFLAQGGKGAVVRPSCKLEKSLFQQRFITQQIILLAREGSLLDNDTSTRFLERSLFSDVEDKDRCYLMKGILSFTVRDVLMSYQEKFPPYMQDVLAFLNGLKSKLNKCTMKGDDSHIQKKIDSMKSQLKQMGKDGEIKVIGEVDLLFTFLGKYCV